jgi:hypothetical protein
MRQSVDGKYWGDLLLSDPAVQAAKGAVEAEARDRS